MSVEVDGDAAGSLPYGERLTIEVSVGSHRLQTKMRSYCSSVLDLDLARDESAIVAVRPSIPKHRTVDSAFFTLVRTDDYADRGPSFWSVYRDRPPAGYRRLGPRERIVFAIAFGVLVIGQVLGRTPVGHYGLIASIPAMIVVVALAVRMFWYRPPD